MNTSHSTKKLAAIATAGLVSLGVAQVAAPAHATARHQSSATRSAATPTTTRTTTRTTTSWTSRATRLGSTKPSTVLHLAVWLKQRDTRGLAARTRAIYTRGNAQYHRWLTPRQVMRRYAPTEHQIAVVKHYLTAQGFRIESVASNRAYVNVSGTTRQAEHAFGVKLSQYRYQGHTYRGTTKPRLGAIAGGHIDSVGGLDTASTYRPMASRKKVTPADSSTPWKGLCGFLDTTQSVTFDKPSHATESYTGFLPCNGYTGTDLRHLYGVDQLSMDAGAGQTVAIVDAYGSPTIRADANKFSTENGLPKLDQNNFQIVTPPGIGHVKDSKAQDPSGWLPEVAIDVEAVHAMAPGAKIVLVAAPNDRSSLDEAVNWILVHHLANIVTNSWGFPVDLASPGQGTRMERILETAAAEGIGVNFSTGDDGDNSGRFGVQTVDFPATSPWANAVGGTSLFADEQGNYDSETGWGDTFYRLAVCDTFTTDSNGQKTCTAYDRSDSQTLDEGFIGGAGGGLSNFWQAQPWQESAIGNDTAVGYGKVGSHRAIPDISMVGDPETGMQVWLTDPAVDPTQPVEEQWGGTSLSSPLFAGLMADVDQARAAVGDGPAGLASQYVYDLPQGAIRDALPPTFDNPNPSAAAGPGSRSLYYGSFNSGSFFNVGFNADTSLGTTSGWDDVTGVGTPYAPRFVEALK
ncbi:MAG TPA: S53 family peptidase [Nocardioides sp.]|uniref:S53 family peptidase n=1 Tax=Nocardioides sp. TaxID=35761 RepID=UPI002F3F88B0